MQPMSVRRHGYKEWGHLPLTGNVVKCFRSLVTDKLSKVSVDEAFMHLSNANRSKRISKSSTERSSRRLRSGPVSSFSYPCKAGRLMRTN